MYIILLYIFLIYLNTGFILFLINCGHQRQNFTAYISSLCIRTAKNAHGKGCDFILKVFFFVCFYVWPHVSLVANIQYLASLQWKTGIFLAIVIHQPIFNRHSEMLLLSSEHMKTDVSPTFPTVVSPFHSTRH